MSRRHGRNAMLAGLLTEADMSAADLARDVNRLAAAEGVSLRYDRTTVAHWLTGSRPRGLVPQLVAEALTRRIGRPIDATETGLTERSDETRGGEADVSRDLVVLARRDAHPAGHAQLLQSVFRQRGVPAAEAVHTPQPVSPTRRHGGLTGADVGRVRFMVSQFAAGWFRYGGGHARTALASYLGDDVGRLLVLAARPDVRADLLSATAQLTHLLGDMSSDAGHQGLSQRYYFLALGAAAEAGDLRTRTITLRATSVQAVRMNAFRYAADLADAAVTSAGESGDGALRAFVLAQRANALALVGEHRRAHQDLEAAEGSLDETALRQDVFSRYPRAGFAYRKGQTLHLLGDARSALDALRYAAAERPAHEHRLRALSQARVALVLLEQGMVEEACTYGQLFAEVYPLLRSRRSLLVARELRARLTQFRRVPEAAALLGRISAITLPKGPA
ncbi:MULTISPECIES: tol-pal system YbgF family protein [unclassified Streptomyces]|uniref:tetratricopeptide repeat protein n=1 Tax=unclassified Streptomyces TaxID=2593676 RepID=UPI0036674C5D